MPISVEEVRAQFRSSGKNPASEHQIMTLYNVVGMNGLQGNRHYASYFALQNIDSITSYDAHILLQVLLNKNQWRYIHELYQQMRSGVFDDTAFRYNSDAELFRGQLADGTLSLMTHYLHVLF